MHRRLVCVRLNGTERQLPQSREQPKWLSSCMDFFQLLAIDFDWTLKSSIFLI